jgi:SAM-dependent methyltransferase
MKIDQNHAARSLLTPEEIEAMSYVDFIGLIRETNRCPGGKDSIRRILQNTFVTSTSKVLEIGSNTGFTSLEIARIVGCQVTGIDVAPSAIEEAKRLLETDDQSVRSRVQFGVGDACALPFPKDSFDVVIAGGALGFIHDRGKALFELRRVLRPWGFLSITTLYYRLCPPPELMAALSKILGFRIEPHDENYWIQTCTADDRFELFHCERCGFQVPGDPTIVTYVDYFLRKPHLLALSEPVRNAIRKRWRNTLEVFATNHRYLNYFMGIFRKRHLPEEPELFLRDRAKE